MYKNKNAVVVLGAGASKLLGFPLQNELISFFKKACHGPKREGAGSDGEIIYQLEHRWGRDIEEALTILEYAVENNDHYLAYSDTPEEHLREIKRLIWRTFKNVSFLKKGEIVYRSFLNTVFSHFDSCNFVSLNWDVGLESLLTSLGKTYSYGITFDSHEFDDFIIPRKKEVEEVNSRINKRVLVLKPHGSLNWKYCRDCRALVNIDEYEFDKNICQKKLGVDPNFCEICPSCASDIDVESIIIPPSHNKRVRLGIEDHISRKIFHQFRSVGTIIFVGYSFRQADYDIRYLLASALQNRTKTTGGPHAPIPWDLDVAIFGNRNSGKFIKGFVSQFGEEIGGRFRTECFGYLESSSVGKFGDFLQSSDYD